MAYFECSVGVGGGGGGICEVDTTLLQVGCDGMTMGWVEFIHVRRYICHPLIGKRGR